MLVTLVASLALILGGFYASGFRELCGNEQTDGTKERMIMTVS